MIENDKTSASPSEDKTSRRREILKNIPCFLAKCTILTVFALGMIEIFKSGHSTLGLIIISVLCFLIMVCRSLIFWKKKQDKKDGYIEKEG